MGDRDLTVRQEDSLLQSHDAESAIKIATQRVAMIQNIFKNVMKEGRDGGGDYGIVPGCGKKPSLLKAGAEKLIMTFGLSTKIAEIKETDLGNGHREYQVLTSIFAHNGQHVADGVGTCSSMESKYRYRGGVRESTAQPVPAEYWNLKNAGKINEALALIGGPGFGVMKDGTAWVICIHGEKMENPDPADQFNTILKMAKKRSLIDAVLTGTGASDIFTQDIEDMNLGTHTPAPQPAQEIKQTSCSSCGTVGLVGLNGLCGACVARSRAAAPPEGSFDAIESSAMEAPLEPTPIPAQAKKTDERKEGCISKPQAKRLFAIATAAGWAPEDMKFHLREFFGFDSSMDISWQRYNDVVNYFTKKQ